MRTMSKPDSLHHFTPNYPEIRHSVATLFVESETLHENDE